MQRERGLSPGQSAVAGLLLLLALPLVADHYTITPLLCYALLGLSLGVLWGYGGVLCFGQGAFFGIGAYAYAIASINIGESTLPFFIAIAAAGLAAMLLGCMIFYWRISDVYLAVVTLVFTLLLFRFLNTSAGPEYAIGSARLGGFNGIPGFKTLNVPGDPGTKFGDAGQYYFAGLLLIGAYVWMRHLFRRPFGRVIVAIREHERRCEFLGYDVRVYKTALFTLTGAIAGLGGCLFANWAEIVTPQLFALALSAEAIIWVLLGGIGTMYGPILGAVLLGTVKLQLGTQTAVDNLLVMGAILIVVVLVMPRGIAGHLSRLGQRRQRLSRPRPQGMEPKAQRDG